MTQPPDPIQTIAVVGGGPAGLYLAYLLKQRRPELIVEVFERGRADNTWGFGVVLADGGLRQLAEADTASYEAIARALHPLNGQTFVVNGEATPIDRTRPGGAIQRLKLLQILQGACREVGVILRFETDIPSVAALDRVDLVVGADGANSVVRESFAEGFGTEKRLLHNRFAWFGVDREFDGSFLNFKSVPGGGLVGHYYSYAPGASTFVMECDERTWLGLGLDGVDDTTRRLQTQAYFEQELEGFPLIENNSIWRQFPVITNRRWSCDRYVLIGDALRTAHFSIGSGTRMALEDAIALADAILREPGRAAALSAFQSSRSATMVKLASAAEGSFNWYEDFSLKLEGRSPVAFALSFLRRTGRITPERLLRDFPRFVEYAERHGVDLQPLGNPDQSRPANAVSESDA